VGTSLIEENPDAATKFTTSLSKVYRYVLEQKNKDLVTVAEELKFAELYMSLIKMRFEDSIVFTIDTISNPEAKVVPLALQFVTWKCGEAQSGNTFKKVVYYHFWRERKLGYQEQCTAQAGGKRE